MPFSWPDYMNPGPNHRPFHLPISLLTWLKCILNQLPDFPLLHRPSILERLYSGSLGIEKHSSLFLNALFALAIKYTDDPRAHFFDLSLIQGMSGTESLDTTRTWKTDRRGRGRGFSRRASQLFQEVIQEFENLELDAEMVNKPPILLIQGAVLLSYAELTQGAIQRAYSLISTCVRLAYDAGLDRIDSTETEHSQSIGLVYSEAADWQKEELRRAWWCIWELESFVCNIKCCTRLIRQMSCETKLPMDDVDWFESTEIPSYFLPRNFEQWSAFGNASPRISLLANRIVALHFLLAIAELEGNESPEIFTAYSQIERCVTIWRRTMAPEFKLESQFQNPNDHVDSFGKRLWIYVFNEEITMFIAKLRMFEGFNDATAPVYCQSYSEWLSSTTEQDRDATRHSQSGKFFETIRASDNICGMIKKCPSYIIHRSSPLIAVGLWAPACIQFLVKIFSASNWELREKASLSLQTLVSAMEQFAEYSALCQIVLARFQEYVQSLSRSKPIDAEETPKRSVLGRRILSLPKPVDDAIMGITELLNSSQNNGQSCSSAELDQGAASTELPNTLWSCRGHEQDLETLPLSEDILRGYDWIHSLLGSSALQF
ncbi:fungal-specific transcription factor domain-containing protein [Trichoderma barbatum]